MNNKEAFSIEVTEENYGERLDIFISSCLENQSRKKITDLIKDGFITVSGEKRKPGYKVKPGDSVKGSIPFVSPPIADPENIDIDILYDDEDIIVLNKQADLVVHPAPGNYTGTLVNALLYHFPELKRDDNDLRPGIVHRLDKDTTGVMVVAKNEYVQRSLSESFKERSVSKSYFALVHGLVDEKGVIDEGIGRHNTDRKKMSTHSRNRKNALTKWKKVEDLNASSLVECSIETGRTHQIRVHMAHIGHNIIGDQVYGLQKKERNAPFNTLLKGIKRQMLHSHRLIFEHPSLGREMAFEADMPADMQGLLNRLR